MLTILILVTVLMEDISDATVNDCLLWKFEDNIQNQQKRVKNASKNEKLMFNIFWNTFVPYFYNTLIMTISVH